MTVFNTYGFYNHIPTYMGTIARAFQTYRLTGKVSPNTKSKLTGENDSFRVFINTIYCDKSLYLRWTYTECHRYAPDEKTLEQFNNFIDTLYQVTKGLQ